MARLTGYFVICINACREVKVLRVHMWLQVLKHIPHNLRHHRCGVGGSLLMQIICRLTNTPASHAQPMSATVRCPLPLITCKPLQCLHFSLILATHGDLQCICRASISA